MSDTDSQTASAATDDWAAAMAEQAQTESAEAAPAPAEAAAPAGGQEYARAEFPDLHADNNLPITGDVNMDVILDIPVTISMEIGHTKISIRNLLQLNQGSVVELDRLAGEPMDVMVNNCLIAHGEVVVVNEKFGIRLTDVVSAAERVKKLR
ncbi:MAG TPA: flagellar motor switch protein FliN [Gammaproteobacteria bacterium]|nr:flagellar motor switch protein FliN [Gammaproteobacteria bacterium]